MRPKTQKVAYSSLPEDMQVLITELLDENPPEGRRYTAKLYPLRLFPRIPLGNIRGDERGESYVQAMLKSRTLPPILLCGTAWVDGKHRVEAAYRSGEASIWGIDLLEFADGLKIDQNANALVFLNLR